jgi:hypothetical protein
MRRKSSKHRASNPLTQIVPDGGRDDALAW